MVSHRGFLNGVCTRFKERFGEKRKTVRRMKRGPAQDERHHSMRELKLSVME
jgi:hypothetical protein